MLSEAILLLHSTPCCAVLEVGGWSRVSVGVGTLIDQLRLAICYLTSVVGAAQGRGAFYVLCCHVDTRVNHAINSMQIQLWQIPLNQSSYITFTSQQTTVDWNIAGIGRA